MKLSINIFLTLDGVMQGPGSPQEDTSDGFSAGGWLVPHFDADLGAFVDGYFQEAEAFLYGRSTYEIMAAYWPAVTDPQDSIAAKLNTYQKYVVSSTLTDVDASWAHSTVLHGDPLVAVCELKKQPGKELQVHGCRQLALALHTAGLVDIYRLMIFPVLVGAGKRLFDANGPTSGFRTVSSTVTGAGVTALVLEPGPFTTGGFTVANGKEVTDEVVPRP
jgi:dihydrofolate reductase